jgi:hypothetical protein
MQVGMALTPNSLARRKPGVQIPSPPPPNVAGQSVARSHRRRSPRSGAALGPRSLPAQLDHHTRLGLVAGHIEGVQAVAERRVGRRVQVAVAAEGEADGGVTGAGGDILGAVAGGDPQGDGRVAQVVDAQAVQVGLAGRRPPDAGVVVVGRLQQRSWTAEDGSTRSAVASLVGPESGVGGGRDG